MKRTGYNKCMTYPPCFFDVASGVFFICRSLHRTVTTWAGHTDTVRRVTGTDQTNPFRSAHCSGGTVNKGMVGRGCEWLAETQKQGVFRSVKRSEPRLFFSPAGWHPARQFWVKSPDGNDNDVTTRDLGLARGRSMLM